MATVAAAPAAPAPAVDAGIHLPPLLPICAALLLGIALGPARHDVWRLIFLFALAAGVAAVVIRTPAAGIAACALGALALGLWRAAPPPPRAIQWPAAPVNAVRGTLADWPRAHGESVSATVQIAAARTERGWEPAHASVRALLPNYPAAGRGDSVVVGGSPAFGSGAAAESDGFLYGQWLRIEQAAPATGLDHRRHALQERLIAGIMEHMRVPESGFAAGVLLGSHSTVDEATLAALNATGTTQHIVISGWNIALVAGALAAVGRVVGVRRRGIWLGASLAGIAAYTVLVGADASVVRAAIMGAGGLIAPAVGRRADPLLWLALAMAAMVLHDPAVVGNLSFLLSCAATFGVLVVAPALARWLRRSAIANHAGALTELFAVALGAQLMTEPLILHQFGRVSLVSAPANIVVEPLVPAIMVGAAVTALVSLLHLGFLAAVTGACTAIPAWLFLKIVTFAAMLPGASLTLPQPGTFLTVLLYAVPAAIAGARMIFHPLLRTPGWSVTARDVAACALGFALVAAASIGLILRWG
jgi:ComEC/Rec2-related protein